MSEVLLINCRTQGFVTKVEHLGLGYLAAALSPHDISADILDASFHGWRRSKVLSHILQEQPRLVGFTVYYNNIVETLATSVSLRQKGYSGLIFLGGHHASFNAAQILADRSEIDAIILSEGEGALVDLAKNVQHGISWKSIANVACRVDNELVSNPCRPLVADIDTIPFPKRDGYKQFLQRYKMASLVSSRGCHGRCSFCSIRSFYRLASGKTWRPRSAINVVDEIESLMSQYGIDRINFIDDEFIGAGTRGRARAWAIGEEILRRRLNISFNIVCRPDSMDEELLRFLRSAGLYHVRIGLESWVPRQLALYSKGITVEANRRALAMLDRLGLDYMFFLIPADPFVTVDELLYNLNNIESAGIQHAADGFAFSQLMVFPGTTLEHKFEKEGLIQKEPPRKKYLGSLMYQFQDEAIQRIYTRWHSILKDFGDISFQFAELIIGSDVAIHPEWLKSQCQEELNKIVFSLFKELVLSEKSEASPDIETLAQTEFDRIVFDRLIFPLGQDSNQRDKFLSSSFKEVISPAFNLLGASLKEVRLQLDHIFNNGNGVSIPDNHFIASLRTSFRQHSLIVLNKIMRCCQHGSPRKAMSVIRREISALSADVARLEAASNRGVFSSFEETRISFAGASLPYPSLPLRRAISYYRHLLNT
jgi:radical SAM superfamily enzyme YgiQ (UPF0313 family)